MRRRFTMLRVLLILLTWLAFTPVWADGVVHLLASEAGGAYREAADAFRAAFAARRPVKFWTLAELDNRQIRALTSENNLIVPIGLKAARAVAEHHGGQAAVLTLMIPHVSAERLVWPANLPRRKVSHVHIDQPVSRTLSLVEAVFPRASRIGLVVSAENAEAVKGFQQEAARRHLSLNLEWVARGTGRAGIAWRAARSRRVVDHLPVPGSGRGLLAGFSESRRGGGGVFLTGADRPPGRADGFALEARERRSPRRAACR